MARIVSSTSRQVHGDQWASEPLRHRSALQVVPDNPPCALCGGPGHEKRAPHHLTHGLVVWLCGAHRDEAFLKLRSGHEFTDRLAAAWAACGDLTNRKRQALEAHLRAVQLATIDRDKPGSYSWPELRREAERRFEAGEAPATVIVELRRTHRDGPAMVPSIRTMRRWFTQARWLDTSSDRTRPGEAGRPTSPTSPRRPFVDLMLTGVAYPTRPPSHFRSRAP